MNKKILIALLFSVSGACSLIAGASGVDDTRWTSYPIFIDGNKKIIATDRYVYASNGSLYSYDVQEKEQKAYDITSGMKSNITSDIFYNYDKNYLVATHPDGNIDILYSDGRICSITDIAYANLSDPTINSVCFDGERMFVAGNFGLVSVRVSAGEVIESGLYSTPVTAAAVMDGKLLICTDNYVHTIDKNKSIRRLSDFKKAFYLPNPAEIVAVNDSILLTRSLIKGANALTMIEYHVDENVVKQNKTLSNATTQNFIQDPSGNYYVVKEGKICGFNSEGMLEAMYDVPANYEYDVFGTSDNFKSVWCLDDNGFSHVMWPQGDAPLTVITDRILPQATYTKKIGIFEPASYGRDLYFSNYVYSTYKSTETSTFYPSYVTRFNPDNGRMTSGNVFPIDALGNVGASQQNNFGKHILGLSSITTAPDEPGIVYIATGNDGIHKINSDTQQRVGGYTNDNSPFLSWWGINTFGVKIDKAGNLWVITYGPDVWVLPAEKRKLPTDQVSKEDWITLSFDGFFGNTDALIFEAEKSGVIFLTAKVQALDFVFVAYDTNGTPYDFTDDSFHVWKKIIDQDGKSYSEMRNSCFAEDKDGRVWFGTEQGVFIISNPRKAATDPSMTFTHVKVPRNDGTNEADYLLGTDLVTGIAVDHLNRKWLIGEYSGLLCVSPNGSQILEEFTSENSPLPSKIHNVWADKQTGMIYVGTNEGLYRYDATLASGSADDLSNVYAYPNPVKPEYGGMIHITGLMENTLVKIADAAGGVVAQGRAENGEFLWNGCNFSGSRVKTGVYYVFASQNTDGSSHAVTKILVVN